MLTTSQKIIDLGSLGFGQPKTFEYTITNDSPKDAKINRVQVSCSSCTKATAPSSIKANQSAIIKVTYTPGVVGKSSKWLDIVYNDDERLRLEFKAVIHG